MNPIQYGIGLFADWFAESTMYNLTLSWMLLEMGLLRYLVTCYQFMFVDNPLKNISRVECPVLVVRGERDMIISNRYEENQEIIS